MQKRKKQSKLEQTTTWEKISNWLEIILVVTVIHVIVVYVIPAFQEVK